MGGSYKQFQSPVLSLPERARRRSSIQLLASRGVSSVLLSFCCRDPSSPHCQASTIAVVSKRELSQAQGRTRRASNDAQLAKRSSSTANTGPLPGPLPVRSGPVVRTAPTPARPSAPRHVLSRGWATAGLACGPASLTGRQWRRPTPSPHREPRTELRWVDSPPRRRRRGTLGPPESSSDPSEDVSSPTPISPEHGESIGGSFPAPAIPSRRPRGRDRA
jgi:hypothetical protein